MKNQVEVTENVTTDLEEPQVQLKVVTDQGPVELFDDTRIEFVSENPKREGTKIHKLWDTYSKSRTIHELKINFGKGWKGVVKFDLPRGHLKILD